jgi:hypothetical protein
MSALMSRLLTMSLLESRHDDEIECAVYARWRAAYRCDGVDRAGRGGVAAGQVAAGQLECEIDIGVAVDLDAGEASSG